MKRKFIDDRGRIFGVINLLDLIAILVVLVLLLGLAAKFLFIDDTAVTTGNTQFTTVVKLSYVRQYTVDALKVGDTLYESDYDGVLGVVTDVRVEQGLMEEELVDGTVVLAGAEGRYDLYITVDCKGRISDGRYYVNKSYELNANSARGMHTKYASFVGTVIDLHK